MFRVFAEMCDDKVPSYNEETTSRTWIVRSPGLGHGGVSVSLCVRCNEVITECKPCSDSGSAFSQVSTRQPQLEGYQGRRHHLSREYQFMREHRWLLLSHCMQTCSPGCSLTPSSPRCPSCTTSPSSFALITITDTFSFRGWAASNSLSAVTVKMKWN